LVEFVSSVPKFPGELDEFAFGVLFEVFVCQFNVL